MTKAYMSPQGNDGRILAGWCDRDRGPDYGKLAEQEARAILAETEPRVPCRDVFNVGRTSNTEHSNVGPLALCHEPYKCLAESLAAFIALEIS